MDLLSKEKFIRSWFFKLFLSFLITKTFNYIRLKKFIRSENDKKNLQIFHEFLPSKYYLIRWHQNYFWASIIFYYSIMIWLTNLKKFSVQFSFAYFVCEKISLHEMFQRSFNTKTDQMILNTQLCGDSQIIIFSLFLFEMAKYSVTV